MSSKSLREQLSDLEHEQWAHWTAYMLDSIGKAFEQEFPGLPLTDSLEGLPHVKGWRRQIATPYDELTEKEKDSDREWADRVLAIVRGLDTDQEGRSIVHHPGEGSRAQ